MGKRDPKHRDPYHLQLFLSKNAEIGFLQFLLFKLNNLRCDKD
jgi:hypothetical protein